MENHKVIRKRIEDRIADLAAQLNEFASRIAELESNPDAPEWEIAAARQALLEFQEESRIEMIDIACDVGDHSKACDAQKERIIEAEAAVKIAQANLDSSSGTAIPD